MNCLTNFRDSQLFLGKSRFLEEKAHFFFGKKVDQRSGANIKKLFFAKICYKFLAIFGFSAAKMQIMIILTSVWSAQDPNAGRNTQHITSSIILILSMSKKLN